MFEKGKNMRAKKVNRLSALIVLTFLLGACGSASNESTIATSVAMTVQAQNQLTATAAAPVGPVPSATLLPGLTVVPTLTNIVTPIGTIPVGSSYANCAKASFIGENYPDGSIFRPDETFYKTWQIRNDSNCTWDSSYKIVFWDGDVLGGAYVYALPQSATPGLVFDIPLYLTVPTDAGSYTGKWMLQTPDGIPFGVGEYSVPLSVDIIVSTDKKPDYGIVDIQYRIERVPAAGCATNVFYYIYATVSVSGPINELVLVWDHSDGGRSKKVTLEFDGAGSQEIMDGWSFHLGATPGEKWFMLSQLSPEQITYDKQKFEYLCGNN
jgi:hypothetical protein